MGSGHLRDPLKTSVIFKQYQVHYRSLVWNRRKVVARVRPLRWWNLVRYRGGRKRWYETMEERAWRLKPLPVMVDLVYPPHNPLRCNSQSDRIDGSGTFCLECMGRKPDPLLGLDFDWSLFLSEQPELETRPEVAVR